MGGILGRLAIAAAILALSACQVRSISNSGYQAEGWGRASGASPLYAGELSPYDVLGLDPTHGASNAEIQAALTAPRQPIAIRRGSSLMVVQSGAAFPDPEMTSELERYYAVSPFTGVPLKASPASYTQLLRLAAAKGGFETVMVYWGVLESASKDLGGKAISWVPVIGGIIPDQNQYMRIRLMVAVIDTRTGRWESFTTQPLDTDGTSSEHARAAVDQEEVARLKAKAYHAAVETLVERYGR
jgi:hypothetical protein